MERESTLCWDCARANPGNGCCWADKFKPVDGWEAKPTLILNSWTSGESFHVTKCPLFKPDKRR